MKAEHRLIVVSNRLPITAVENTPQFQPSSGGLISALAPLLDDSWACWVGSAGASYEPKLAGLLDEWCSTQACSFAPVILTSAARASLYPGLSYVGVWRLFYG